METINLDVLVIGAGAAGLMCAITAGQRGRRVLVLDHANKVGKKILMSGGGRCNFTNLFGDDSNYLCKNPHFVKSALSRYTPYDFLALVEKHGVEYVEKQAGQLFCRNKAKDIVALLLNECTAAKVQIRLNSAIKKVSLADSSGFELLTDTHHYRCASLVVATGGLSIPTMGASPFGYRLAEQFGLNMLPTSPALVPFTMPQAFKERFSALSGVSCLARVELGDQSFTDHILFTHRGISGPAILQISSFWQPGQALKLDLLPQTSFAERLRSESSKKKSIKSVLSSQLPKRLLEILVPQDILNKPIGDLSKIDIDGLAKLLHNWTIKPDNTEGYRTAEVTLGGIDTDCISSKTMEVKTVNNLYFIGEVLDVTGHLGGYNFQWAWASGYAAGLVV